MAIKIEVSAVGLISGGNNLAACVNRSASTKLCGPLRIDDVLNGCGENELQRAGVSNGGSWAVGPGW